MKKLRIGLFFSLYFKAPHHNKRVICAPMILIQHLASALRRRGHTVHFLVPKNSATAPEYIRSRMFNELSSNPRIASLVANGQIAEKAKLSLLYNGIALKQFLSEYAKKIDILHLHHPDYILPALLEPTHSFSTLLTMHDPVSEYYQSLLSEAISYNPRLQVSFVSKNQSRAAKIKRKHIVYNGINIAEYPINETPNDYLAFVGRLIQEKGIDSAIRAAVKTKHTLRVAGKMAPERMTWNKKLSSLLKNRHIDYRGTIPYEHTHELYRNAKALLMPIQWEEPFGLVMIEAMASGTPVIAFNRASVPEIVKHKTTGFIVRNESEMIRAIRTLYALPQKKYAAMRRACRAHVEKNFSTETMISGYEALYLKILNK